MAGHALDFRFGAQPVVQADRRPARDDEALAAGIPVAPLGDADERHADGADLGERGQRGIDLPLAAVDQDEVRPGREVL